ncbi:type III toxin-antitoxin system TenpIN family toxin [Pseudomonas aeruginosa]
MNERKAPIGAFFFSGERMLIQKLEDAFFNENVHLEEVLDKRHGQWDGEKKRGYGILLIEHNNLRFGIPLRSHISHSACFKTVGTKGLDFSKAVLLTKDEYISQAPFMIPSDEYVKIKDRTHFIQNKFSKYVDKYVLSVKKSDTNALNINYRFTTLKNYHAELGLPVTK